MITSNISQTIVFQDLMTNFYRTKQTDPELK